MKAAYSLKAAGLVTALLVSQPLFGALVLNPAKTITHKVQVQPIQVIQDAAQGGASATMFGNATQKGIIEGFIDDIWAQAGIDIEFLSATTYVDSFAYNGFPTDYSATARPTADLSVINSAAGSPPKSSNSSVLNMFFVDVVPGFSFTTENTANGLAFVDGNGVAQFVGDNLLSFTLGQEVIAKVVAHEIGHNLGLPHIVQAENLMQAGGSPNPGERLTQAQIDLIMVDNAGSDGFELLQAIPEPTGAMLGVLALGVFGLRRRR